MSRYKIKLAYCGKGFLGFQSQPQGATVQSSLEEALYKILGERTRVVPSGRTDTGVHALEQVVHFDLNTDKALQRVKNQDIIYKINSVLPDTVRVTSFKRATPQFHARNQASQKTYVYNILMAPAHNQFLTEYVWHLRGTLDEPVMKKAAACLIGKKDFSAFCASDSTAKSKVKEILKIALTHKKIAPALALPKEKYLSIEFTGKGFLKQMVRNLVGTLVAVGRHKITPEEVKGILLSKDRRKAAATAPAQGLFLKNVKYVSPNSKDQRPRSKT